MRHPAEGRQRREDAPAEEHVALAVVARAVERRPIVVPVVRHEVDGHPVAQPTFQDGPLDGAIADRDRHPGHGHAERAGRGLDAAMPGHHHADVVPQPRERLRQRARHVGEAPGLRERRHLGRDVEDPERLAATAALSAAGPRLGGETEAAHGSTIGIDERGHVGVHALQVRQDVQVDLGGLEGLGQPRPEPVDVGLPKLPLPLADHGPLLEHLVGERPVPGRDRHDRPLEVLRHLAVEVHQLGLARLGEPAALVELLPGQLHQVLVDDVSDVLEVADEPEERDLPPREILGHRLPVQPGEVELDLPLQVVYLVVPALDVLEQLLAAGPEHARGVPQHALDDVGRPQRLPRRLADGEARLVGEALVEVSSAEALLLFQAIRHGGDDQPGGPATGTAGTGARCPR